MELIKKIWVKFKDREEFREKENDFLEIGNFNLCAKAAGDVFVFIEKEHLINPYFSSMDLNNLYKKLQKKYGEENVKTEKLSLCEKFLIKDAIKMKDDIELIHKYAKSSTCDAVKIKELLLLKEIAEGLKKYDL